MKLMRIILSILLLLVAMGVLVWVLGVPRQPAAQNVTATTKSSTTQPVLRIGITPERDIIRQRKIFRALGDYLGEKLNYRVELVTASEYRGVLQDLGDKRVDVAMLGSLTTVLSIDRYQARILASPVLDLPVNKFHSVIFVPAQSPVNRMEDLAGRSIVMTRASGGGSLYAVYELFRLGLLNRPDTPRMIWVGTHDDAVVAVAEGRADGGVVKDLRLDDYERMHPEKKMRRLAISDEVPEYALVARAGLADGLEAELRRVVLMMDQDEHGKSALQLLGATRFQPYSVAEYKAMYDMIEGIGPNWELVGIDGPAPKRPVNP